MSRGPSRDVDACEGARSEKSVLLSSATLGVDIRERGHFVHAYRDDGRQLAKRLLSYSGRYVIRDSIHWEWNGHYRLPAHLFSCVECSIRSYLSLSSTRILSVEIRQFIRPIVCLNFEG